MKLTIEKLVFGGQGLAQKDGKTYLVWNALPGETVEASITKKAHSVFEAEATQILRASPERTEALEAHHLACSPWQIMGWEAENQWKSQIAKETYEKIGGLKNLGPLPIRADHTKPVGYRNKMEFSFAEDPLSKKTSLAFFNRETHTKTAIPSCVLAEPVLGKNTHKILSWLIREGFPARCLKNLLVRSDHSGHSIAALFIEEALTIKSHPELDESLLGFHIYHGKSTVLSAGEKTLSVQLLDASLKFGLLSFFQIHYSLFEKTLQEMSEYLDKEKNLIDYYSGVGAIGIGLKNFCKKAFLVDSHKESIDFANVNIRENQLGNFHAYLSDAAQMTRLIDRDSIILFDPPRAGLDQKIIRKILSEKPPRLIYLSCNIATHARDIQKLLSSYKLADLKLYNFFPRTPHVEALAVLDRLA